MPDAPAAAPCYLRTRELALAPTAGFVQPFSRLAFPSAHRRIATLVFSTYHEWVAPDMKRFPEFVCDSMRAAGAAATCLPVRLDEDYWETAFFFQLAGPECKEDRRLMRNHGGPLPVGLETDLI